MVLSTLDTPLSTSRTHAHHQNVLRSQKKKTHGEQNKVVDSNLD